MRMLALSWRDDGLTSWGVIKSHHSLGDLFNDVQVEWKGPLRVWHGANGWIRWLATR